MLKSLPREIGAGIDINHTKATFILLGEKPIYSDQFLELGTYWKAKLYFY